MPADDGVIHLSPPYPDCRFRGVGNAAAFDLSAQFLRVSHVVPSLPVDVVNHLSLLIGSKIAAVSLTQSFEQSMLDNVTLQAFVVCLAASWQFAIQPSGSRSHDLSRILANQRFHSDVKNEHPVVPNAITKWHHADVGNV
jgi:hypothetical protein